MTQIKAKDLLYYLLLRKLHELNNSMDGIAGIKGLFFVVALGRDSTAMSSTAIGGSDTTVSSVVLESFGTMVTSVALEVVLAMVLAGMTLEAADESYGADAAGVALINVAGAVGATLVAQLSSVCFFCYLGF